MKILMVCLGNICRSPIAEGVLKHKAAQRNISITVDSAGTGAWHSGENPDSRAIAIAKKYGVDISDLIARQFQSSDFDEFDHIFVMDESNLKNVLNLARSDVHRKKVKLLLNECYPGTNSCVPDPYFGGEKGFDEVFKMIEKACDSFLKRIEEELK